MHRRLVDVVAGAATDAPSDFVRAKAEAEEQLRQSGMAWTVLRPDAFMDTWFPMVVGGPALSGQTICLVGQGKRRHSFVAQQDVAAFAVVALQDRRAERQAFVIGGPQPVSWLDVVAAFERELSQRLPVQTVAPGEPVPGLPDFVSQLLATLEAYDSPIDMGELAATYKVALTSHDEFVRGFVHATALT